MSILINMEMPNKKNGAVLIIYPDGKCAFEDGKTYQAVPVPKHGRLIDADEIENRVVPASRFFEIPNANVVVLGVIKATPTIIPAEEAKE